MATSAHTYLARLNQLFKYVVCLHSNQIPHLYSKYDWIIGCANQTVQDNDSLERLLNANGSWKFGCLSYDLKNRFENLHSKNASHIDIPELSWFEAEFVIAKQNGKIEILTNIQGFDIDFSSGLVPSYEPVHFQMRSSENHTSYIEKVQSLQQEIQLGNIYEVNFCQEFYSESTTIDPVPLFKKLNDDFPTPFAAFLKMDHFYSIGNSPERYLARHGNKLISQPIKGTIRRGRDNAEDEQLKHQLLNDPKEHSENTMIVDLVRNDLSRTAIPGTVKVEELCELYSFPLWHQLISTVVSEVPEGTSNTKIIRTTFPMGSMTGAPKISAMKLIEKHEKFKRGIYSGSIGYIDPDGDFDLNVVIRTFNYDEKKKIISYPVGGAITAKSVPENEYEECMVKAQLIHKLFK